MFNLFFSKSNPDILRLYCSSDDITSGKPIPWKKVDDFSCESLTLEDEISIHIKKTGWYQTNLRLVVKKSYAEDKYPKNKRDSNLVAFLAAIQQNYQSISLSYSDINDISNVTMVSLNDVNYFEEGDVISVTTGQCTLLNVQENQNIFSLMRIS